MKKIRLSTINPTIRQKSKKLVKTSKKVRKTISGVRVKELIFILLMMLSRLKLNGIFYCGYKQLTAKRKR